MNNKIFKFQLFSVFFTLIFGILFHFTFDWSNSNVFVASFSSINESTWEHLKLLFFPMLIIIFIGYFFIGKTSSNFLCCKTIGILISILFTTIFFYTYTGILGFNVLFIDISSFFLAVILGEYISYKLLISNFSCNNTISIVILISLLLFFIFFTFFPPKLGIFQDPITLNYGINF